jgi:membrane associated rhomboid family serine protease
MRLPPSRVTLAIVGITVLAWAVATAAGLGEEAALAGGFIPARISGVALPADMAAAIDRIGALPAWLTPLSATLVHGGAIHILFNMLMLGFCGRFVEVALGGRGLVVLYLLGAYAAAAGQYLWSPDSPIAMIGASGAASAVLGAYALLYGQRRTTFANRTLNMLANVLWLAVAWIGVQLLIGVASHSAGPAIAIFAHIGGFLAGLALARPLLLWKYRGA